MKKSMKRLVAVAAAICLCATMVSGVAAADGPDAEELSVRISVADRGDGTYDATYSANLRISERYAKMVALNKDDSEFLKDLRFTCVLKDGLVEQMDNPSQDDYTFTGPGAANFDFVSCEKKNGDEVHVTYKLNEAEVDSWRTMSTAEVKAALQQRMIMSSTQNVTEEQLSRAETNNMLQTESAIHITSEEGEIPFFEEESITAAEGTTVVTNPGVSSGGGGGGGSSAAPEEPEEPEIADETGVSDMLITKEHITYMVGDNKGNFNPDASITRAEVAQVFYALLKDKNVKITAQFDDVEDSAWYSKAVNTLASLGKLSGVGNNKFEPNRSITRAEFAAIAASFAKDVDRYFEFDDVPESHWAYRSVTVAAVNGWVTGVGDNMFAPNRSTTRAEVATIVNHMLGRLGDDAAIDAGECRQFPDVTKSHWAWYEIAEAATEHDYEFNADYTKETWKK